MRLLKSFGLACVFTVVAIGLFVMPPLPAYVIAILAFLAGMTWFFYDCLFDK